MKKQVNKSIIYSLEKKRIEKLIQILKVRKKIILNRIRSKKLKRLNRRKLRTEIRNKYNKRLYLRKLSFRMWRRRYENTENLFWFKNLLNVRKKKIEKIKIEKKKQLKEKKITDERSDSFLYGMLVRKFMRCGKLEKIRRKVQEASSLYCFLNRITFEQFTSLFYNLLVTLTMCMTYKNVRRGKTIRMLLSVSTIRRSILSALALFLQGILKIRKRRKFFSFEYFFFHELSLGLNEHKFKEMKAAEMTKDYYIKLSSVGPKRRKFRYGHSFSKAARMYAAEKIRAGF